MKIQGQLEWTDYLEANKLHLGRGRWIPLAVIVGFTLIFVFIGLSEGRSATWAFLGYLAPALVVVGGIFIAINFFLLPYNTRRIFNQQKELSAPFEVELTESVYKHSSEYGVTERPWLIFTHWKENDKLLVIYHSDVALSIFPKRIFTPEQIDFIRERLKTNNISTKPAKNKATSWAIYILIIIAVVVFLFQFRR